MIAEAHSTNDLEILNCKTSVTKERIARLEAIGFVWDPLEEAWEEKFAALQAYKDEHRDCQVPAKWPDNPQLGNWVGTQRTLKNQGDLSDESIARLEAIGFVWDRIDAIWEEKFAALQAYKDEHGDCQVPAKWPDNPQLGNWVSNQRAFKKRGDLIDERIARLEALGIVWDPHEDAWEEMFAALQAYKDEYGHCNVSTKWPDNPQLGRWVLTQRQRHSKKKGKLSDKRIARLEAIGFVWDPFEEAWEEMFAALQAYKDEHGHCNVPRGWPDNPQLGTWVHTQRQYKKRGDLINERIARLEALGLLWQVRKS